MEVIIAPEEFTISRDGEVVKIEIKEKGEEGGVKIFIGVKHTEKINEILNLLYEIRLEKSYGDCEE